MLWLCGPAVKTQPSHGCYWGSIPHRVTNICLPPFSGGKFYISEGILTQTSAHTFASVTRCTRLSAGQIP